MEDNDGCGGVVLLLFATFFVFMYAIGSSDQEREARALGAKPALTLDELRAYEDMTVSTSYNDFCVVLVTADERPSTLIHLDPATYHLVRGWGQVRWKELREIAEENEKKRQAGTVPPADKAQSAQSLKREAR